MNVTKELLNEVIEWIATCELELELKDAPKSKEEFINHLSKKYYITKYGKN